MSEILESFEAIGSRAEVIAENKFVKNDAKLALALAEASEIAEYATGEAIIKEGRARQRYLYFVLSGKVSVHLGSREVFRGGARNAFGEFPILSKAEVHNVTVRAEDTVAVGRPV